MLGETKRQIRGASLFGTIEFSVSVPYCPLLESDTASNPRPNAEGTNAMQPPQTGGGTLARIREIAE